MSLPAVSPRSVLMVASTLAISAALGVVDAGAQQQGAQNAAPVTVNAQGPGTTRATSGPVVLSGSVADPDNAVIPGATLTLTPVPGRGGQAYVVKSGDDGTYSFRGVPPGNYALTIVMPGFASYVREGVKIGDAASVPVLNAKMAIENTQTTVNVTANQNTVSVDQDNNASSTVLTGKDLDALSDDPDELSSELTALAGPSSGPNGGQIYIDGFTGGQLPPKSSIREIRINQNPFSAQYDKAGFGRIEIFTKPGTDKFRLFAQINGNEKDFNTGSPFTNNATQPGYQTIFSFGQFSGPLSKTASFTVGSSFRQIQSNAIIDPPAIFSTTQNSGVPCAPEQAGCTLFQTATGNGYSASQFVPQIRYDVRPRFDLALGAKNTLTVQFQYEHNSQQNQGIGGTSLYSQGYNETSAETTLQMSDTQVISDKIINETRFEYQRPTITATPFTTTAQVQVQGAFTSGQTQSIAGNESDTQNHFEVQNYTSIALAKHFIRIGGRFRDTSETNTSTVASSGDFTYASIQDYEAASPEDFTITQYTNNPSGTVHTNTEDVGVYAEDDWKPKPTWTLSYGLRFESQNYIHDHADFAPRTSTAYQLNKKTVLRAGFGIFYDRLGLGNQLQTIRNNGVNQQQYTISSASDVAGSTIAPTCSPANPTGPAATTPYGCDITASRLTVNTIQPNLHAPYTIQENIGFDRQLFPNATMSVNYQHIEGQHQFVSNVPNYATATAPTAADPAGQPLNYQYASEAAFNQNQLIVNANVRNFHNASFGGYYALNFALSNTGGIGSFTSVPNDLHADWGRASFDRRNLLVLWGSYNLPHLVTISPLLFAFGGNPYNITSGLDPYNIDDFSSRAEYAPAGDVAGGTNYVKSIGGCGTFATPVAQNGTTYTQAPINACTGPAQFTLNLRIVKTWGFGPPSRPDQAEAGPGGGHGGGGHGPGGGERGRGGPPTSGKRYNLGLGLQAQNVFNVADLSTPVGTLTSPSFGTSTSLAGGPFTTSSAVRRIQFQATFSF